MAFHHLHADKIKHVRLSRVKMMKTLNDETFLKLNYIKHMQFTCISI